MSKIWYKKYLFVDFLLSSRQRNNIYDICTDEPTYLNKKRFIIRYLLISVNIYALPTSCIDGTYPLFWYSINDTGKKKSHCVSCRIVSFDDTECTKETSEYLFLRWCTCCMMIRIDRSFFFFFSISNTREGMIRYLTKTNLCFTRRMNLFLSLSIKEW